jgi:hypothetical protein
MVWMSATLCGMGGLTEKDYWFQWLGYTCAAGCAGIARTHRKDGMAPCRAGYDWNLRSAQRALLCKLCRPSFSAPACCP